MYVDFSQKYFWKKKCVVIRHSFGTNFENNLTIHVRAHICVTKFSLFISTKVEFWWHHWIYHFRCYQYLNNAKSSNPWILNMPPFVYVFLCVFWQYSFSFLLCIGDIVSVSCQIDSSRKSKPQLKNFQKTGLSVGMSLRHFIYCWWMEKDLAHFEWYLHGQVVHVQVVQK